MIVRSWRTLLASIPKDVPSTCSPASMRPVQRYLESVSKFTNNFTQYRIFRISSVPCDPNGNTTMTSAWFVWIHRLKSMIIRIMRRRTELWPKLVSVCQKQRVAVEMRLTPGFLYWHTDSTLSRDSFNHRGTCATVVCLFIFPHLLSNSVNTCVYVWARV